MAEVGQVAHATILRVKDYGAIVRLEDGTVGLVHISELAYRFVEDITEYCNVGARVMVRVLRRKNDGRWEFSMKQVTGPPPGYVSPTARLRTTERADAEYAEDVDEGEAENFGAEQPMYDSAMPHQPAPRPARNAAARAAFDEKLRDFLSDSSERIEDVRRHHDHRLNGKRR